MFSFHYDNKPGKKSPILVHILWLLKGLKVLYGIKNSLTKSFTIKIAFLSTRSKNLELSYICCCRCSFCIHKTQI